jgi:hypothetical protein
MMIHRCTCKNKHKCVQKVAKVRSFTGGGAGGVGLSVDSTTFLLSVYNLQTKFEQNLHLQINPKIYNLRFQQNALQYPKNQRNTFKHDSIEP